MAKWEKGQSGNPRGRAKGQRPLAEALREYGAKPLRGKGSSRYAALAKAAFEAALTGHLILPSGRSMDLDPDTWFDLVKWIGAHGEGPVRDDSGGIADGTYTVKIVRGAKMDEL